MLILPKDPSQSILYVGTIGDRSYHLDRLFKLHWDIQQLPDSSLDILVDFHYCEFLNHIGVAFLGGLAREIEARGGRIRFDWNTLARKIHTNLGQNGFLFDFGGVQHPWDGNSIPYRSDRRHDSATIGDYLRYKWLGKGWVNISPGLQGAIAGQVSEIYGNAFEHSHSNIGVFSCGQHYPKARMLHLTVIDFGIGIPASVRSLPDNSVLSDADALTWAFRAGTSTKQKKRVSRGLGLNLLSNFVANNHGSLKIFSNEGGIFIDDSGIRYENRYTSFTGTLVNIAFRCDESYYCLASETPDSSEPWF